MGNLLSDKGIQTLRAMRDKLNALQPSRPLKTKDSYHPAGRGAWLGKVVGIDLTTLGGNRKLLSVQRITTYPYLSEGLLQFVDGGIDSQIVCGCEVLVFSVNLVAGWPEFAPGSTTASPPSAFALPVIAVDQRNIDEPDPSVVVMIIDPSLPLLPSTPCVAPEP